MYLHSDEPSASDSCRFRSMFILGLGEVCRKKAGEALKNSHALVERSQLITAPARPSNRIAAILARCGCGDSLGKVQLDPRCTALSLAGRVSFCILLIACSLY